MTTLSVDQTVRHIAGDLPGAAQIFRDHGINFCCGGDVRLDAAAAQAGIPSETLLDALTALQTEAGKEAPDQTPDLIAHILHRYHETHRRELDWLIAVAAKVERVHGDHEQAPRGLSEALLAMRDDLESHMMKEERVLFPAMARADHPDVRTPILCMRDEHEEAAALLEAIEHAANGMKLPEGACGSWTALYTGLRKFCDDLVMHMYLENHVLFPRFEGRG